MNAPEMHIMFRQFAQQMGMQNVRAILPEQIDLILNTVVTDTVNQIIKENISTTNDRVITDNSKIGQINALRSLYKVSVIDMSPKENILEENRVFSFSSSDRNSGRMTTDFRKVSNNSIIPNYMFLVDFAINYKKVTNQLGYTGKTGIYTKKAYSILTPDACAEGNIEFLDTKIPLDQQCIIETFVIDSETEEGHYEDLKFAIEKTINPKLKCITNGYTDYYLGVEGDSDVSTAYGGRNYVLTKTFKDGCYLYNDGILYNPIIIEDVISSTDYIQPTFNANETETNYFPVRLIDDTYLADTLNDFILKPRLRSPIIVTYNNDTFDIYIDKFNTVTTEEGIRYVLKNDLIPYKLRMSYIAKPKLIRYSEDIGAENQDCDLPVYMHEDIVKQGVDMYRRIITGNAVATQGQEQQVRQENIRNNYRNEGNV